MDLPPVIELRVGEHWRGELPGLAAAGYQWLVSVTGAPDAVAVAVHPVLPPRREGALPEGGAPVETIEIMAQEPGTALVALAQRRAWERSPPLRSHQIEVRVTAD